MSTIIPKFQLKAKAKLTAADRAKAKAAQPAAKDSAPAASEAKPTPKVEKKEGIIPVKRRSEKAPNSSDDEDKPKRKRQKTGDAKPAAAKSAAPTPTVNPEPIDLTDKPMHVSVSSDSKTATALSAKDAAERFVQHRIDQLQSSISANVAVKLEAQEVADEKKAAGRSSEVMVIDGDETETDEDEDAIDLCTSVSLVPVPTETPAITVDTKEDERPLSPILFEGLADPSPSVDSDNKDNTPTNPIIQAPLSPISAAVVADEKRSTPPPLELSESPSAPSRVDHRLKEIEADESAPSEAPTTFSEWLKRQPKAAGRAHVARLFASVDSEAKLAMKNRLRDELKTLEDREEAPTSAEDMKMLRSRICALTTEVNCMTVHTFYERIKAGFLDDDLYVPEHDYARPDSKEDDSSTSAPSVVMGTDATSWDEQTDKDYEGIRGGLYDNAQQKAIDARATVNRRIWQIAQRYLASFGGLPNEREISEMKFSTQSVDTLKSILGSTELRIEVIDSFLGVGRIRSPFFVTPMLRLAKVPGDAYEMSESEYKAMGESFVYAIRCQFDCLASCTRQLHALDRSERQFRKSLEAKVVTKDGMLVVDEDGMPKWKDETACNWIHGRLNAVRAYLGAAFPDCYRVVYVQRSAKFKLARKVASELKSISADRNQAISAALRRPQGEVGADHLFVGDLILEYALIEPLEDHLYMRLEEGVPQVPKWTAALRCEWYGKWIKNPAENPCPVKPVREWIENEQKAEKYWLGDLYATLGESEHVKGDPVALHEAGGDPDWNLSIGIPDARSFVTDPKNVRLWFGKDLTAYTKKSLLTDRGLAWAEFNVSEQNKRQCALYSSYRKLELRKHALIKALQLKCPGATFPDLLNTPRLAAFHKRTGVKYNFKELQKLLVLLKPHIPDLGCIFYAALQVEVAGDQWKSFRVTQWNPKEAKTDAHVEKFVTELAAFDDDRSEVQQRYAKEAEEVASRKRRKAPIKG